jgi:hypothetical protein
MSENETPQEENTPVVPDLASLLAEVPGSPDPTTIESWKKKHGEIFCSGFTDSELFIWRPVTRREYLNLQKSQTEDFDFQEALVKVCVLWGSDMVSLDRKAGSINTLAEQILQNSNFMPPQIASNLVIKL